MASYLAHPGRNLLAFLLVLVAIYAGLVWHNDWVPKLGLDLQGGTRITLEASTATGEAVTPEKLEEAAGIIDSRVNAYGVAESEVSTQGDRNIVVEIPGEKNESIVDTVRQTAQLRFRLVAASQATQVPLPTPTPSPSGSPSEKPKSDPKPGGDAEPSPAGRALSQGLVRADETPKPQGTKSPGPAQTQPVLPTGPGGAPEVPTNKSSVQEMLAWTRAQGGPEWQQKFAAFSCDQADDVADNPAKPLLACDDDGVKYLLSPALIEGTELADAGFGIPQNDVQYVVNLEFDGGASDTFAELTRAITGTQEQFAIVLDGEVLSAPVVTSPITNGQAQISGDFNAESAESLANSLKYGALPLTFEVPVISEEGPTLAADQLSAGLWAGALGLGLVLIYCMAYYRGLGVVVVSSLFVAGALIFAAILFLSANAGFTLTLPGIAGLIVGIGITADSFIVLFERIRDEMRDGKSVRVAIDQGWSRAIMTCVIADAVSLLAAVVLFIFAIGVVKGFAFALGISTALDLVVFYFFTKPMVMWLGHFKFFSSGHRLSGLSAEQAGIERIGATMPAGGLA